MNSKWQLFISLHYIVSQHPNTGFVKIQGGKREKSYQYWKLNLVDNPLPISGSESLLTISQVECIENKLTGIHLKV